MNKFLKYKKRNGLMLFLFLFAYVYTHAQSKIYKFSHQQMGTVFSILIETQDSVKASKASQKAFQKLDELNLVLSDYREDSEINQLCKNAYNNPVRVSNELFEILNISKNAAMLTHGKFDVTIGTLTQLWRRMKRQKQLPSNQLIHEAKSKTGIHSIVLNPDNQTVELKKNGVRIDFGGIGKGYAEDKMMLVLEENGIDSAMIEAGGNIIVSGGKWEIEINNQTHKLSNCGISTSGSIYQFVEIEGKKYSHIVDPTTGLGFTESKQISVIAQNSTTADWASTAIYLMSKREGKKLANKLKIRLFTSM